MRRVWEGFPRWEAILFVLRHVLLVGTLVAVGGVWSLFLIIATLGGTMVLLGVLLDFGNRLYPPSDPAVDPVGARAPARGRAMWRYGLVAVAVGGIGILVTSRPG